MVVLYSGFSLLNSLSIPFPLFQSGLPAMNVEILSQFPSPPVPNLPALAMAVTSVMPQHQQPMMTKPAVSMAMPTPAPVMAMTPVAPTQAPTNTNFIASFPPAQVLRPLVLHSSFVDLSSLLTHGCVDSGDQS